MIAIFFLLTGYDDTLASGDSVTLCSVGCDYSMIRLSTFHVVHRNLCARHISLQHQDMVRQARHHYLKVDEVLGVWAAPAQFKAAGGDIIDVQLVCV